MQCIVRLNGQFYRVSAVPASLLDGAHGSCDSERSEILVNEDLSGCSLLETLIHEMLHGCAFDVFAEEFVTKTANSVATGLFELGYRLEIPISSPRKEAEP
jgi:hypothetical protein